MQCFRAFPGLFAAIAITSVVPVSAQSAAEVEALRNVNERVPAPTNAQVAAEAVALLKTMVEQKFADCTPQSVTIDRLLPATATRLAVDGIKTGQLKNAWTAYGVLNGCPVAPPARFIILRMPDDKLLVRLINTGESLTSASQMRDTSMQAALAASAAIERTVAGCKSEGMKMSDTRVVSRAADLGPDVYGTRYVGSWRENWRFTACGVTADVPIAFRADGQGGVYDDVEASEVTVTGANPAQ